MERKRNWMNERWGVSIERNVKHTVPKSRFSELWRERIKVCKRLSETDQKKLGRNIFYVECHVTDLAKVKSIYVDGIIVHFHDLLDFSLDNRNTSQVVVFSDICETAHTFGYSQFRILLRDYAIYLFIIHLWSC